MSPLIKGKDVKNEDPEHEEAPFAYSALEETLKEFGREAMNRREFLSVLGASLALGGLAACSQPREKIVPYVRAPEYLVPGTPLFYATSTEFLGASIGVIGETHEGRPTKLEGNTGHPGTLGGSTAQLQAEILSLYDPARAGEVSWKGNSAAWDDFVQSLRMQLEKERPKNGAGIWVVSRARNSPVYLDQLNKLLAAFPAARCVEYETSGDGNIRAACRELLGTAARPLYRIERADVLAVFDGDLLLQEPGAVYYAKSFAARRHVRKAAANMNRYYVAEPCPTVTGSLADHHLAVRSSRIYDLLVALARRLGISGLEPRQLSEQEERWLSRLAEDLNSARGRSLIAAGLRQPKEVHILTQHINNQLGNNGKTVDYYPASSSLETQTAGKADFVNALRDGRVALLLILGGNPVYTSPPELELARLIQAVPWSAQLSLSRDETSEQVQWHIPQSHFLEHWGDTVWLDGTASLIQPLISPLKFSKDACEIIEAALNSPPRPLYDVVRSYWQTKGPGDFEKFWEQALTAGTISGTSLQPLGGFPSNPVLRAPDTSADRPEGVELNFMPDPCIFDGRFAGNSWLQELPKPYSKLVWDNALYLAPATAKKFEVKNGDVVEVSLADKKIAAPVWLVPGHAEHTVTAFFGYGRTAGSEVALKRGYNAYYLLPADFRLFAAGAALRKTGDEYQPARRQRGQETYGRDITPSADIEDLGNFKRHELRPRSFYPDYALDREEWGMSIDLSSCIGCNACVVACQAENNIPSVGRTEAGRGRMMHWIRVDQYFEGTDEEPLFYQQPVPCMHCEHAPCELVCPTAATVHSTDGLNEMVYNRCVGTRYCSNNCPYKVRRFNFFGYSARHDDLGDKMQRNPDVTVRERGVMEKCTYCIQRINAAKIAARQEKREVRDGEVIPACQAACPTDTIIFGNVNKKESKVSRLKAEPHDFALLGELGTRPRTTYLARITNRKA